MQKEKKKCMKLLHLNGKLQCMHNGTNIKRENGNEGWLSASGDSDELHWGMMCSFGA